MLYIMTELMFLKVLMLIKQVHLKNILFATIDIFWIKDFKFQSSSSSCQDVINDVY